jgi:hypothetical protein
MERGVRRSLCGIGVLFGVALSFMTCSNPIDILQTVTTEVKKANAKFLIVKGLQSPTGTTSVNPGTPITIEFDRPVDTSSVSAASITIKPSDGSSVEYSVVISYSNANKIVTLTPKPFLEDNTSYDVTVTGGVLGDDASEIETPMSWSFTTGVYPAGDITITDGVLDGQGNPREITYIGAPSPLKLWIHFTAIVAKYRMATSATAFSNFTHPSDGWLSPTFSSGDVYTAPLAIELPAGDGEKPIYIQFLATNAVDMSLVATDTVILDTTNPTVSAGTMSTLSLGVQTRTTNASASDVSGITAWSWTKESGPGTITFGTADKLNTTIKASVDGAYSARLTVTDGVGHTNYSLLTFSRDTVPPNVPVFNAITTPTVAITPTWTWASGGNGGNGRYAVELWYTGEKVWSDEPKSKTAPLTAFPCDDVYLKRLLDNRIYPLRDGLWTLKVAEFDAAGNISNFAESTIQVVPALPLDKATDVNSAAIIRLEWHPMTNGYDVYGAVKGEPFKVLVRTPNENVLELKAGYLKPGVEFHWYIRGAEGVLPVGAPEKYFTFTTLK